MFGSSDRNHDKKLENLRGMLIGIQADKEFSIDEALYLDSWLRDARELHHYGDIIDLIEQISDILEDGIITPEEMQDTFDMISDIEAYGEFKCWRNSEDSEATEFLGFLQGISVDDHISDKERQILSKLLINLPDTIICNSIIKQLSAAISEDDEALLKAIRRCCGQQFKNTGSAQSETLLAICDDIEDINMKGRIVCFSGAVSGMSRSQLKSEAEKQGYIVSNKVTLNTDYLVIGNSASKDWISTSYGRKIETALKNKEKGALINILTYEMWCELSSDNINICDAEFIDTCLSIEDIYQAVCKIFSESTEYVIQIEDFDYDTESGKSVSIHKVRKNGIPLKKSEFALTWTDNEERARPWVLSRDKGRASSFKSIESAQEALRNEINLLLSE